MALRTIITDQIAEGSTPLITATFRDEAGAAITSLTTATLTLYDLLTGAIINGRNDVSLLADGLNVIAGGNMTWRLAALDTVTSSALSTEKHIALIEWTWGSGLANKHEIEMRVANLAKVP